MDFQEFPKMIYGPNGEVAVVADKKAEDVQLIAWQVKRGPGRPKTKDVAE